MPWIRNKTYHEVSVTARFQSFFTAFGDIYMTSFFNSLKSLTNTTWLRNYATICSPTPIANQLCERRLRMCRVVSPVGRIPIGHSVLSCTIWKFVSFTRGFCMSSSLHEIRIYLSHKPVQWRRRAFVDATRYKLAVHMIELDVQTQLKSFFFSKGHLHFCCLTSE